MQPNDANSPVNTPVNTDPQSTHTPPTHSKLKLVLLGTGAVILLSIGLAGGFLLGGKRNANSPAVTPSQQINKPTQILSKFPEITPLQTIPSASYTTNIYTIEANKFKKLTTYNFLGSGSMFDASAPVITKNGYIYYANGSKALRYSLNSEKTELVYEQTEKNRYITRIDTKFEPYVYITEMHEMEDDQTIAEFNLQTRAYRAIGPIPEVVYGNPSYLFRSNTGDIITSIGGDGCGGGGPVYKFIGDKRSDIAKIGMGCGEGPNLIGVLKDENALLLLDRKMTEEISDDTPFGTETLLGISQLNVDTGNRETLFDLSAMQIKSAAVLLDTEKKQIAIISEENLWILDLPSKAIKKKIAKPQIATFQDLFADDKFYEMDYGSHELVIFDLNLGSIERVSWVGVFSDNDYPTIIDIYNGQPVFYTTKYNE